MSSKAWLSPGMIGEFITDRLDKQSGTTCFLPGMYIVHGGELELHRLELVADQPGVRDGYQFLSSKHSNERFVIKGQDEVVHS